MTQPWHRPAFPREPEVYTPSFTQIPGKACVFASRHRKRAPNAQPSGRGFKAPNSRRLNQPESRDLRFLGLMALGSGVFGVSLMAQGALDERGVTGRSRPVLHGPPPSL